MGFIAFNLFAQEKIEQLPLSKVTDTTIYPFYYISPDKVPVTVKKLPTTKLKYYSLSRSLKLPSLGINIPVLIGKTVSNIPVIVIDENVNYDLSDDSVIYFRDTINSTNKGNYGTFKNTVVFNHVKVPIQFDYSIVKPSKLKVNFGDSLENKIHFMVRPVEYRKTTILSHELILYSKHLFDFSRKSSFIVARPTADSLTRTKINSLKDNMYYDGDVVLIGKENFVFESVSKLGDTLYLKKITTDKIPIGNKVGFRSPDFQGKDLVAQKIIDSKENRGKYLLLDFWGTWCGPCIQLIGETRKLYEGFDKQKIFMVGVCYDDDEKKVMDFIGEKNINWPQIFNARKKAEICKLFDVESYPTFILIDPDGKIVFRDTGITGHDALLNYLKKLNE